MAIQVSGVSSPNNVADVDSSNRLAVNLPLSASAAGVVKVFASNGDPITSSNAFISGSATVGAGFGRLKVGLDSLLFYDNCDGTAFNTNLWMAAFNAAGTAYTIAQANGILTLNNGNATTATSNAAIVSNKWFQRKTSFPLANRWQLKAPNQLITNGQMEFGFGTWNTQDSSATGTITDGVFFRFSTSGLFAVSCFNSVETTVQLTNPTTTYNSYMIVKRMNGVDFYVNDVLATTIQNPSGNPSPNAASRLPIFARAFNTSGSTSTAAPRLDIGEAVVFEQDINNSRPWSEQLVTIGRSAIQGQITGSFTQLAKWDNNNEPLGAALSNTVPSYNTLGGLFLFTAPAAALTDNALFGYQMTSGSLFVTYIKIDMFVSSSVAGAAQTVEWGVSVGAGGNSSGASLATAETAAAVGTTQKWAPRRMALGVQSLPSGSTLQGAQFPTLAVPFSPPLVVEPGRYLHLFFKQRLNTGNPVLAGTVTINGYVE